MILNQCETFGLPGNRIGLPLLEGDEGTATPRRGVGCRNIVVVITNLVLLGASNGRREARGHLPTPKRR